jgi:hypothetical protein
MSPLSAASRTSWNGRMLSASALSRPSCRLAAFARTRVFLHRHRCRNAPGARPPHVSEHCQQATMKWISINPPGSPPVGMPLALYQRHRSSHRESRTRQLRMDRALLVAPLHDCTPSRQPALHCLACNAVQRCHGATTLALRTSCPTCQLSARRGYVVDVTCAPNTATQAQLGVSNGSALGRKCVPMCQGQFPNRKPSSGAHEPAPRRNRIRASRCGRSPPNPTPL